MLLCLVGIAADCPGPTVLRDVPPELPELDIGLFDDCCWTQIDVGTRVACGIRPSGSLECTGDLYPNDVTPPDDSFDSVSAWEGICGVTDEENVRCWGLASGYGADGHAGSSVATGTGFACIDTGAGIDCYSDEDQTEAPPTVDEAVARLVAGAGFACLLTSSGEPVCWALSEGFALPGGPVASLPDGPFATITAGLAHACGLRPDGQITCWGEGLSGELDAPPGTYVLVAAGSRRTCAVDDQSYLRCWGDGGEVGLGYDEYLGLSTAGDVACAVLQDGSANCWRFSKESTR